MNFLPNTTLIIVSLFLAIYSFYCFASKSTRTLFYLMMSLIFLVGFGIGMERWTSKGEDLMKEFKERNEIIYGEVNVKLSSVPLEWHEFVVEDGKDVEYYTVMKP